MSGYLRQYSRKHFEFGLNSGGNAKEIAKSIRENGGTNWNTRNEKELTPGHMCNLIVLWMLNEICPAGGGNGLITRDKAQLRIHIEEGVDAIQEAVRQAEYTRVFVVCGGDALAWNTPPVWNELAAIAARQFRQNCTPAITGGGFFRKINMMNGNKQEWHLSRDENIKMEVMGFLESISDLLHHFSFDALSGDKYKDLIEHSPTLKKARVRCRNLDQVREANRVRKEEDLRKEQEAREKSAREKKANEDELREVI
eukprot:6480218-Amphidinium_carterae.1